MTSISIKEFFALAGSQYTNADARIIGPVLHELSTDKEPSVADVVEIARSTNCPLHGYFEWDDKLAANTYREGQAREMLRTIRVRYTADKREFATRAFKIKRAPVEANGQEPYEDLGAKPYGRQITVADNVEPYATDALRDLDAWRLKYAAHARLFGAFAEAVRAILNQIEELRDDYEEGHLKGPFRKMVGEFLEWHRTYLEHTGAARLYGDHTNYMRDAINDARAEFEVLPPPEVDTD